jgi:oligopeptide/dipeptide ABC transporter ATP-binding protein
MGALAQLQNLKVYFYDGKDRRFIRAVKDVGFTIEEGTVIGLVGESGCGKSVTALSMMGLVDGDPGIIGGSFFYRPDDAEADGLEDALGVPKRRVSHPAPCAEGGGATSAAGDHGFSQAGMYDLFYGLDRFVEFRNNPFTVVKDPEKWFRRLSRVMEHIRGSKVSMIFQNPINSLNPFLTIGRQLTDTITRFSRLGDDEAWERGVNLLRSTLLYNPEEIMHLYPSQLSLGMAQRVVIAVALSSDPRLLIADEPTSGLDTTNKYKVIDLLESLVGKLDLTLLFISHNIHIVGLIAHSVVVMYAGLVVETGSNREVIGRKRGVKHPYTEALVSSIPTDSDIKKGKRLGVIPGMVPNNKLDLAGCPFLDRCSYARGAIRQQCGSERPKLVEVDSGHFIRCFLYY